MASEPILVTGATGFLGREICQTLSTDYETDTLGRSSQNTYCVDLSRQTPTFEKRFNIVIHAAGKAHVIPRTQTEKDEFFQTNFQGTLNLLRGLKSSGKLPLAFVFISTVAVYGVEEGEMITESFPLKGESPYAKSKMRAELYLTDWCEKMHVKLTILRLPLLVGQNPPGNLGAVIRMMRNGLYVGIGSGEARKSMVLASDVARFIPQVAKLGGTYNLADGYHPTLVELENAIARNLGRRNVYRLPNSLLRLVARAGDVLGDWSPINSHRFKKLTSSLTFSDAKARGLAGWKSCSTIDNLPKLA